MSISKERTEALLSQFAGRRLLVLGDVMLDRFIYGSVRRISPEAPVPVVNAQREIFMPGGASNVALNAIACCAEAALAGVCGTDVRGQQLVELLKNCKVDTSAVMQHDDWLTTVKTRVIAEAQQVVRVDWDSMVTWTDALQQQFMGELHQAIEKADGLVIEDYGKGVLNATVVDAAVRQAQQRHIPVSYDPKEDHPLTPAGITIATPNRREAFALAGMPESPDGLDPLQDADLIACASTLCGRWKAESILITLGGAGMLLYAPNEAHLHIPTKAQEVYDVSGAGDTVVAVCTLALASGATLREAAELANAAAGVVVGKHGTATCTHEEILNQL